MSTKKNAGPVMAYAYSRISHHRQKAGVGLERQDDGTAALCKEHGWTLDESDSLVDVGSGFHGDNLKPAAALGRFLEMVESGRVVPGSVLVLENLDRLSRQDSGKSMLLFLKLVAAGIKVATVSPRMVYQEPLGTNQFLALSELMRGNSESSVKHLRGTDRWVRNRVNARAGTIITRAAPRWLTADRTTNKWTVDKAKKKVIEKIFAWCIEGVGVSQITRRLNEAEIPPFETRKRKTGRAVWTSRFVGSLLRGRAVLGEYQPGSWKDGKHVPAGDPIPGYYPAVIEEETYWLAQAAMNGRKRTGGPKTKNKNIFTGLLFDVWNDCKFYGSQKGNGLQLVSEVWWAKKLPKYSVPVFPYDRFETALLRSLREIRPSDLVPGHKGDKLAELSARLTEVQDAINEIQPRLIGKNIGALLDRLEQLDAEKEAILGAVHAEKTRMANGMGDALGEVHGLVDLLEKADDQQAVREKLRGRINLLVTSVHVAVVMSDRRVKKFRPKAAVAEVRFKSGAVRHVVIPWGGGQITVKDEATVFLTDGQETAKRIMAKLAPVLRLPT